ncbi:MAG: hypothetical protein AAB578_02680, partial [Elusimicrobiota bacterium]
VFNTMGDVYQPEGIAFDRRSQPDLWVAAPSSGAIYRFANDGFGNFNSSPAEVITALSQPWALAFDNNNNLFVSTAGFNPSGGGGKLWYFDNPCRPGGLCLSGTPTLIQSGVDIAALSFDGSGALRGTDLNTDSIVKLSTYVPAAPAEFGSASGTMAYDGIKTGQYLIAFSTTAGQVRSEDPATQVLVVSSGAFTVTGLLAPKTYYVVGFLDTNGDFEPKGFEPQGGYSTAPASGLLISPVSVTVNSTATGVNFQLRDIAAISGNITNNSLQSGDLRVQAWVLNPAEAPSEYLWQDDWLSPGTTTYAVYVPTGTNHYIRAYVDSNFNHKLDSGEDSGTAGPVSTLSIGATAFANVTITALPPGTLYANSLSLAPADLPTNAYDRAMLRIGLWSSGGNAQVGSMVVSLEGDAPGAGVNARIYKDANGNGSFDSGLDYWVGEQYFSPVANVYLGTQTISGTTQYFFITLNYGYIQPGRSVGVSLKDPSHLGMLSGSLSGLVTFPLASGQPPIKASLSARPFDQGYPTPSGGASSNGGFDFGISVSQGQTVQITASGTWGSGGGNPPSGPDGLAGMGGVGGFNIGALMGRVGGGSWFLIGSNKTFTAPQSGSLYLAMNDSTYDDNSGGISVNVAVQASTITRVWTGASGFNLDANIAANWQGNAPPLPGDSITFDGSVSNANCNWNIFGADIGVLTLKSNYTGTVRIAGPQGPGSYNQVSVSSYAYVDGGVLDLGSNTDFTMQEKMLWVRGGTLDMGQGYNHLRLARPGLRVRNNGHFLSAGGMGPVTVESNNPYDPFDFNVENGTITLNNPSYTEFINSNGVDYSSNAMVDAFHYARFGGNASMSKPALTLHGLQTGGESFSMKGLDFGPNVSTNVSAVDYIYASTITLLDAKGPRMGSVFE